MTDEQLITILRAVPAGVTVTLVGLRAGSSREWFRLDIVKGIEIWR